jgi:Rap1a immunity proteins
MKRYAIAATLLLAVGTVSAGQVDSWLSANELARACRDQKTSVICIGYVIAVADAMARPEWGNANVRACFTPQMEIGQLIAVVRRYVAAHPEGLHYAAFETVAVALSEAFPCPSR